MKSKWTRTFFNQLYDHKYVLILFGFCCIAVSGCKDPDPAEEETNIVKIAEVNGEVLSLEKLQQMFPDRMNPADSGLIANALADRWIRKEVFLSEAKRSMTDMEQLNNLVEDYRESLIIHGYESQLLDQFSDTVVTNQQIQDFFDENPDQFKLKKNIVQYNIAIFPRESIERYYSDIKKLWDNMDDEESLDIELVRYLDLYAEDFVLDTLWYGLEDLQAQLPDPVTPSLLKRSHRLELEDDENFYFLKIIDIAEETDEAPLSYIRTFAYKAILQKRKMKWLDQVKEKIYQDALRNNNIVKYEN